MDNGRVLTTVLVDWYVAEELAITSRNPLECFCESAELLRWGALGDMSCQTPSLWKANQQFDGRPGGADALPVRRVSPVAGWTEASPPSPAR